LHYHLPDFHLREAPGEDVPTPDEPAGAAAEDKETPCPGTPGKADRRNQLANRSDWESDKRSGRLARSGCLVSGRAHVFHLITRGDLPKHLRQELRGAAYRTRCLPCWCNCPNRTDTLRSAGWLRAGCELSRPSPRWGVSFSYHRQRRR